MRVAVKEPHAMREFRDDLSKAKDFFSELGRPRSRCHDQASARLILWGHRAMVPEGERRASVEFPEMVRADTYRGVLARSSSYHDKCTPIGDRCYTMCEKVATLNRPLTALYTGMRVQACAMERTSTPCDSSSLFTVMYAGGDPTPRNGELKEK